MPSSSKGAKVIPITRGFRNRETAPVSEAHRHDDPLRQFLHGLDFRVRAVLAEKQGKWQFLERASDEPDDGGVIEEKALSGLSATLARIGTCDEEGERITLVPLPGFDLAVMLRDGKPCYAVCLAKETSIYIAEATLPAIARYFDELR